MYPRQFKQFLKSAQPDFDERRYGSIADLMRACQKDGLLRLEPLELPTELRLLTTLPSLAVFQYTARPFALELRAEWYDAGAMV